MQPTHVIISRNRPVSGGNGRSSSSFTSLVCQIFTAIVSFALGTMTCLLASNNTMCPPNVPNAVLSALSGWQLPSSSTNQNINDIIDENRRLHDRIRNMEDNQQSEIDRLVTIKVEREVTKQCGNVRVLENEAEHEEAAEDSVTLFPMESVGRFAVAMARTSKQDFADALEMGIPLDPPTAGSDEVLLLYSRSTAIPASFGDDYDKIPHIDMPDAISKCEYLNIVLTDNTGRRNQCVALVPQYESYHIQKWMRLNEDDMIDADSPLRMVSRGQTNGRDLFDPPDLREDTREFWKIMSLYLENIDVVLKELRPILRRIAIDKTVIVMVCNFGQAQLLINFVCAAKSRNLDISNIIVFTTDQETTDIATSLGLAAYYDQRVRN